MEKFVIANKYSYIALHNVEVKSKSFKVIDRNLTIALLLDLINNEIVVFDEGGILLINEDIELTDFEKAIIETIGLEEKELTFEEVLKKVEKIKHKKLENLTSEIINSNIYSGNITIVKSLINLDINYEDNGVVVKEYRTSYETFNETKGYIKQLLETNEYYCLLWLLMHSGDLVKVFNFDDVEDIKIKFIQTNNTSQLVMKLAQTANIHTLLLEWKKFLDIKNEVFKKGFGQGVVFTLPAFERKESIFITTEEMFSSGNESLKVIVGKLVDNGHMVTVLRGGAAPLVDIDNELYELIPNAVRVRLLNVHGIRLRRYFE